MPIAARAKRIEPSRARCVVNSADDVGPHRYLVVIRALCREHGPRLRYRRAQVRRWWCRGPRPGPLRRAPRFRRARAQGGRVRRRPLCDHVDTSVVAAERACQIPDDRERTVGVDAAEASAFHQALEVRTSVLPPEAERHIRPSAREERRVVSVRYRPRRKGPFRDPRASGTIPVFR